MPAQASKFTGCLIGSALGDSIGELAFHFTSKTRLNGELCARDLLQYTDDTAMAMGVAECLITEKTIDPEKLGRIFHRNYTNEPWRGYASGPPSIFLKVETEGIRYSEAAAMLFGGKGSFGNGAAMRAAPVGLFFSGSRALYEQAARSAVPTHSHALALDGAAVQAKVIDIALRTEPDRSFSLAHFCSELGNFAATVEFKKKIGMIRELIDSKTPDRDAAKALGRSVAIHESLPFAIYAFACYPHSFEECIYCAVLNGGDRDTVGAMAGAASGAYLGVEAIPEKWREKLEGREKLESLAAALMESRQE